MVLDQGRMKKGREIYRAVKFPCSPIVATQFAARLTKAVEGVDEERQDQLPSLMGLVVYQPPSN